MIYKSNTTEHPKTSQKLSKTTRQAEKVSSWTCKFFEQKKLKKKNKKTKRELASKGYASSYNVEILNSINAELQLEDT